MAIYDSARRYMRRCGNLEQWVNGYPSRELILGDIDRGVSFVGEESDGSLAMVFSFIVGEDPTYALIEDGEWPDSRPYGTIHRLASAGRGGGMLAACVGYCCQRVDTLRLDTHADNMTMQRGAERLGFRRCGIIYCSDGTPRIAYQL